MNEFRVGEIALAKVGRNTVEVEILECGGDTFRVKSLSTGREFKTARIEKINNNMEESIMPEDITRETEIENSNFEEDVPNPAPECAPARTEKKLSLLDAAVEVLKHEGRPMNTKEIISKAIELNLWQSTGAKTPEQTLYSAIHRENATKENPRILKSALKGKFEIAG